MTSTPSPEVLSEFIARLEKAEGPDRELDAELARFEGWTFEKMKGDAHPYWRKPDTTAYYMRERNGPPAYTVSLDASLALVERVMPGWSWSVDTMSQPPDDWSKVKRLPRAQLAEPVMTKFGKGIGRRADVQAATPALALLLALLTALARESSHVG